MMDQPWPEALGASSASSSSDAPLPELLADNPFALPDKDDDELADGRTSAADPALTRQIFAAAAKVGRPLPEAATLTVAHVARSLAHNFAHVSKPATPPLPPLPPSMPPMSPPPPPLPFVLPVLPIFLTVLLCCIGVCVVTAVKMRKGGGKTPTAKADVDGGGGGGGAESTETGPTNAKAVHKGRGCTDVFCLALFGIFWLGMTYLFYLGLTVGDPYLVVYGKDYLGNRCGRGNFTSRPKVIFPRIGQDVLEQSAIATTAPWKLVLYGICVEECPNVTDPTVCFNAPGKCMTYDYGEPEQWKAAGGAEYYYSVMPTINVINRCIPIKNQAQSGEVPRCAWPTCDNVTNPWMMCDTEYPTLWWPQNAAQRRKCEIKFENKKIATLATQKPSPIVDKIADQMASAQRIIYSLLDAQHEIIVYGIVVPIVLGFAWLALLRFFAKTIIWVALIGIGCFLFMATAYLFITTGLAQSLLTDLLASNSTQNLIQLAVVTASDANAFAAANGVDVGSGVSVDEAAAADGAAGANARGQAAIDEANAKLAKMNTLLPDDVQQKMAASQQGNPGLWVLAAWFMLAFTAVYFILLFLMRAKVRLVAALVKEASVVIKDRPLHVLFPAGVLVCSILHLFFFFLGMLFLGTADITADTFAGASTLTADASFTQQLAVLNQTMEAAGGGVAGAEAVVPSGLITVKNMCYLYFLFGFLWTNQCINNISWTSLSGSYSHWYFFRRDDKFQTRFPLGWATFRVFRYHLGTICFGSFIIATVQLARIILMAIDKHTKQLQEKNKMVKYAMKCLQCCMMCLEKVLKFITDYCYIYVAMQGSGFCRACFSTFKLIMTNLAQLAMNTLVRTILSLIQLLGIPLFCYQLSNFVLTARGSDEPFYAVCVIAAIALIIANVFAQIFACVLDTLFVCCVRDKNEYKGAFMSDRLYEAFGFDPADRAAGGGGEGGGGGGGGDAKEETKQQL